MTTAINLDDYSVINEGTAEILTPKEYKVFYNPVQQFNRDLSTVAIRAWSEIYMAEQVGKRIVKAENKKIYLENKKRKLEEKTEKVKKAKGEQGEALSPVVGGDVAQAAESVGVTAVTDKAAVDDIAAVADVPTAATVADTAGAPVVPAPPTAPFITILEALSATGLRAIRYGQEIPLVKTVVANDMLHDAVLSINRNIIHNKTTNVVSNHGDAIKYMANLPSDKAFHVVDLDPYGTAAPFIDSALNAIANDGLMLVTCTDLGVLAGSGFPEKCFALYGGTTLPKGAPHEAALRLVLHMIATTAAKYKKTIEPVLCLSIDFYVRLFIRVRTAPLEVKQLASKTMITYHCSGCGGNTNQLMGKCEPKGKGHKFGWAAGPPVGPYCSNCGFSNHLCGPMWAGPLQNKTFIDKVLAINETLDDAVYGTRPRIKGMLSLARQELETPFYFDPTKVTSILKTQPIPMKALVTALGNAGFDVSLTHASSGAIKTDAPWRAVLEVFKQYGVYSLRKLEAKVAKAEGEAQAEEGEAKEKLVQAVEKLGSARNGSKNITKGMAGWKIMEQDLMGEDERFEADFERENEVASRVEKLRKGKIVRYQVNPTKNWGPKAKPQ